MELIVFGILLFIACVAGTFVYDHFKKEIAEHGGFFKAKPSVPAKKYTKYDETSANEQLNAAFQKDMDRLRKAARRSTNVTARDGSVNSNLTIEELMAKLEKLKKDI